MAAEWRSRIRTSNIINRMQKSIDGEIEMTPVQAMNCRTLLAKVLPDLKAVEHKGELKVVTSVHFSL